MNLDPESAQHALLKAQQAIQQGDRKTARRWAETAAALSPELEEPWLILAAFANPQASVKYLQRALKINPASGRAREGMHWAVERLRKEATRKPLQPATLADTQPGRALHQEANRSGAELEAATRPTLAHRLPQEVPALVETSDSRLSKSLVRYRWSFLTLIVLLIPSSLLV